MGSSCDIRQFSNYLYGVHPGLHCLCTAIVDCRCLTPFYMNPFRKNMRISNTLYTTCLLIAGVICFHLTILVSQPVPMEEIRPSAGLIAKYVGNPQIYQIDFYPSGTASEWTIAHGFHEGVCEIRMLNVQTGSLQLLGRANIKALGPIVRFFGDPTRDRIFIEDQSPSDGSYGWWVLDLKAMKLVERFPYRTGVMEVGPVLITPDGRKILMEMCEDVKSMDECGKSTVYIFDGSSYEQISETHNLSLSLGSIGNRFYFSDDSKTVYTFKGKEIEEYDLATFKRINDVSPSKTLGTKVLVQDIKQGKALLAHFDYGPGTPPTIWATQLMLLNLRDKTIQSSVRYPFYAEDASLSPDARYVIAFEMPEKVGKRAIREGEPISPTIHIFTVASQEKTSLSLTIPAPAAMSIPSTRLAIKPLAYDPTNRVMKLDVGNELVTLNLEKKAIDSKVSHSALGLADTKRKKMEK